MYKRMAQNRQHDHDGKGVADNSIVCVKSAHHSSVSIEQTGSLAKPLLKWRPHLQVQHIERQGIHMPFHVTFAKKSPNSFLIDDILRPAESITHDVTDWLRRGDLNRKRKIWNPMDSDADDEHYLHGIVHNSIESNTDVNKNKYFVRVTLSATTTVDSRSTLSSPLNALMKMTRRSLEKQKLKDRNYAATPTVTSEYSPSSTQKLGTRGSGNHAITKAGSIRHQQPIETSHTRYHGNRRRKSRTAFSNQQISELERHFIYQKYLTPVDRDQLATSLGMTSAQVITWFQNRRAKLKRDLDELKADVTAAVTHSSEFQYSPRDDGLIEKKKEQTSTVLFSDFLENNTDSTSSVTVSSYSTVMPLRMTSFAVSTSEDDNVVSSSTGESMSGSHSRP